MKVKRFFGSILCLSALAYILFSVNITGNAIGITLQNGLEEIIVVIAFISGIGLLLIEDARKN